jgi:hypothetical protein
MNTSFILILCLVSMSGTRAQDNIGLDFVMDNLINPLLGNWGTSAVNFLNDWLIQGIIGLIPGLNTEITPIGKREAELKGAFDFLMDNLINPMLDSIQENGINFAINWAIGLITGGNIQPSISGKRGLTGIEASIMEALRAFKLKIQTVVRQFVNALNDLALSKVARISYDQSLLDFKLDFKQVSKDFLTQLLNILNGQIDQAQLDTISQTLTQIIGQFTNTVLNALTNVGEQFMQTKLDGTDPLPTLIQMIQEAIQNAIEQFNNAISQIVGQLE